MKSFLSRRGSAICALSVFFALLAGCGGPEPAHAPKACTAPPGTVPFEFQADGHQLGGFIDLPPGAGPHPAIMLLQDYGHTDVTRGRGDFARLRAVLRDAGIASVVWDKAGNGCSGGRFRGIADLYLRSDEVIAAAGKLSARKDIDAARIGVWAIGQGAWVAPMAATRTDKVKFLIVVGAPGHDPVRQQLYMARSNLEIDGYSADEIAQWTGRLRTALKSIRTPGPGSYQDFRRAVDPLLSQAFFAKLSAFGVELNPGVTRFEELQSSAAYRVDAAAFWPAVDVPVLALYGNKDTQFDWREGIRVLHEAFSGRRAAQLTVRVFDRADHRLCGTKTGAIDGARISKGCELQSAYFDTLIGWLRARGLTGS